jgi:hypothetical protein
MFSSLTLWNIAFLPLLTSQDSHHVFCNQPSCSKQDCFAMALFQVVISAAASNSPWISILAAVLSLTTTKLCNREQLLECRFCKSQQQIHQSLLPSGHMMHPHIIQLMLLLTLQA